MATSRKSESQQGRARIPLLVVALLTALGLYGGVRGQTGGEVSACMGTPGLTCTMMALTCDSGRRLFPVRAEYGYTPGPNTCPILVVSQPLCPHISCCSQVAGVCRKQYSSGNWRQLYSSHGCWNVSSCSTQAQQSDGGCGNIGFFSALSNFALVSYVCLLDSETLEFSRVTELEAQAVMLHYGSAASFPMQGAASRTWYCHLEAADCSSALADVTLSKGSNRLESSCTSLSENGVDYLPCDDEDSSYRSLMMTLPFNIYMRVAQIDAVDSAWAVVKGYGGARLKVTCGFTTDSTQVPVNCSDASQLTTTTVPDASTDTSVFPPGGSTAPPEGSVDDEEDSQGSAGATAAAVVVTLLLLAAATVVVLVCLRRRGLLPCLLRTKSDSEGDSGRIPLKSTTSASSTVTLTSQPEGGESPLRSDSAPSSHQPHVTTSPPADVDSSYAEIPSSYAGVSDSTYAVCEEAESEYDHLGKNKSEAVSGSHGNVYGQLEATSGMDGGVEYGYHHLSRKKRVDVINENVYGAGDVEATSDTEP